jgi:hypothetical protein
VVAPDFPILPVVPADTTHLMIWIRSDLTFLGFVFIATLSEFWFSRLAPFTKVSHFEALEVFWGHLLEAFNPVKAAIEENTALFDQPFSQSSI